MIEPSGGLRLYFAFFWEGERCGVRFLQTRIHTYIMFSCCTSSDYGGQFHKYNGRQALLSDEQPTPPYATWKAEYMHSGQCSTYIRNLIEWIRPHNHAAPIVPQKNSLNMKFGEFFVKTSFQLRVILRFSVANSTQYSVLLFTFQTISVGIDVVTKHYN